MDDHNAPEAPPADLPQDPWFEGPAGGWEEWYGPEWPPEAPLVPDRRAGGPGQPDAEVYLAVQRSPEFQQVRSQYRRFVVPAALAFLGWYLAYVIAATVAPGLMGRPVFGPVNVALLAGLGQFATTFLLTWAYARHARLRRDHAALELRWDVAMRTRPGPRA